MLIFNLDFLPQTPLPPQFSYASARENSSFCGACILVENINQALVANAAGAAFIAPPPQILPQISELAEFYLFDAKILAFVSSEDKLELAARAKADAAAICAQHKFLLG